MDSKKSGIVLAIIATVAIMVSIMTEKNQAFIFNFAFLATAIGLFAFFATK